jgi:hypothetical protein
MYGAKTWTLRAVDQNNLESFEMWCWRKIEKIFWTDHVRNEEELLKVNDQRNIVHEIRKRKSNWSGHIYVETSFYKEVLKEKYKWDRSDRKTRKKT